MSGALPPIGVAATPPVSLEDAAAIAAEHWDLHGEVRSLPSERDQNFRIGGAVLKLAHPDEDAALLEAQNAALARIASSAPGLAQEVIPARSGEPLLRLRVAGAERLVRLLTLPARTPDRRRPHRRGRRAAGQRGPRDGARRPGARRARRGGAAP